HLQPVIYLHILNPTLISLSLLYPSSLLFIFSDSIISHHFRLLHIFFFRNLFFRFVGCGFSFLAEFPQFCKSPPRPPRSRFSLFSTIPHFSPPHKVTIVFSSSFSTV